MKARKARTSIAIWSPNSASLVLPTFTSCMPATSGCWGTYARCGIGRPRDQIGADVASGLADLEPYGQLILANPHFVARVKPAAPMHEAARVIFFCGAAQGYTDHPA